MLSKLIFNSINWAKDANGNNAKSNKVYLKVLKYKSGPNIGISKYL